jgi:hypothetical protein
MRIIRAQMNWPTTEYSSRILLKDFFNNIGALLPLPGQAVIDRICPEAAVLRPRAKRLRR